MNVKHRRVEIIIAREKCPSCVAKYNVTYPRVKVPVKMEPSRFNALRALV
jgi:hypothetical protein